ncbi:hypothetical protein PIB30_036198 [Stylosanthes scabra]|uniref:Uncharacterized protein n=1 Tax=Stylosanthes scabra TaxID=79078 RepID=A0ABU6SE65_9FABA|nr:hypothetical protein [Stylosanthes scabra]
MAKKVQDVDPPPSASASTRDNAPFKSPGQAQPAATPTMRLRQKQPIRRQTLRNSPPPSEPPNSSQCANKDIGTGPGPSKETLTAASVGTQSKSKFMKTLGINLQ